MQDGSDSKPDKTRLIFKLHDLNLIFGLFGNLENILDEKKKKKTCDGKYVLT